MEVVDAVLGLEHAVILDSALLEVGHDAVLNAGGQLRHICCVGGRHDYLVPVVQV